MEELFKNPHLVIPVLTYIIAQATKMFLKARKGDFQWKYMFSTGDMPSVHTAVAVSLVMSLGFVEGVDSAVFGFSVVWAFFIVYDSFNVRRAVGEHGGVIMRLIELSKAPKEERDLIKVREVLGHTPLEVLAGAGTGLALGFLLSYRYWPEALTRAYMDMGGRERLVYYGLFALIFIAGLVLSRVYLRRGQRRLPTGKRVSRALRSSYTTPALFGAAAVWLQSQGIRFFRTKGWIFAILIWVVISAIVSYVRLLRKARPLLTEEEQHFKRAKRHQRDKKRTTIRKRRRR